MDGSLIASKPKPVLYCKMGGVNYPVRYTTCIQLMVKVIKKELIVHIVMIDDK